MHVHDSTANKQKCVLLTAAHVGGDGCSVQMNGRNHETRTSSITPACKSSEHSVFESSAAKYTSALNEVEY